MQPESDVPLAPKTTLGVGGAARELVRARSERDVEDAVAWAKQYKVELYVLGGGSNLVVADAGVAGLVVEIDLSGVEWDGARVTAAAGEPWDGFVAQTLGRNLAGLECLSGIPGKVGATPIQNVGAYGQEVSESIESVRALDRETGRIVTLSNAECRFAYRDSFFKSEAPNRFVVLAVTFGLRPGGAPSVKYAELEKSLGSEEPTLACVRQRVLALRAGKSMLFDPSDENGRSCGSFFVNPVVSREVADAIDGAPRWPQPDGRVKLPAGWLVEHAELPKGTRDGAVGLSTRHALSIVAHQGARASDVVAFARRVRRAVEARFGIRLIPEPVFWGFSSLDDRLPDERIA